MMGTILMVLFFFVSHILQLKSKSDSLREACNNMHVRMHVSGCYCLFHHVVNLDPQLERAVCRGGRRDLKLI